MRTQVIAMTVLIIILSFNLDPSLETNKSVAISEAATRLTIPLASEAKDVITIAKPSPK